MPLNWQCTKCEAVSSGDNLSDTMVPGVKLGMCNSCGARRTFRATDREADAEAGERAKTVGMRAAERSETASGWVQRADAELTRLAQTGERFTAETLSAVVGVPPLHPNAMGARLNAAARKGIIRKVGFTKANRSKAHRRDLAVWQGVAE